MSEEDVAGDGFESEEPGTVEVGRNDPGDEAGSGGDDPDEVSLGWAADTVVPLIAAASGIAALFTGQSPTGNAVADVVLTAALGAAIPWIARRATPWSLLLSAVGAFFFAGFQMPATALAAAALVAGLAITSWRPFQAESQAIMLALGGALCVQAGLGLPNIRLVGTASLLAALCLAPLVVAGWRALPDGERGVAHKAVLVAGGFALAATVLAGIAALTAKGAVERAIDEAQQGVDAIEAGDQDGAVELLSSAGEGFATAKSRLGGPLSWPARVVPVVAQHSRAFETAAAQGQELTSTAVRTVTTADVDQIRASNGAIDLGIVEAVNAELTNANLVLGDAQLALRSVRSPWLVPQIDDRLAEVEVELTDLRVDLDLAHHATAVIPGILGADGERTYMVLFIQPAEAREYGGFVGAYGLLRADQGRLELVESGAIDKDFARAEADFSEPVPFPQGFLNQLPNLYPQNLPGIPDLTTIANAFRDLAPQWRDDPNFEVDGVVTIDPFGLAGLLELTGPISVAGRPEPLDADNVVDYLLRDQYLEFDEADRDERRDGLSGLAASAFGELLSVEIPGPERLGHIFGPLARTDRLAFVTFDQTENAFLQRVYLDADLPIVGEGVEMIGVFNQTGVAGKLDAYLERHVDYEVVLDPTTGRTEGRVVVSLTNQAPSEAPSYVLQHAERPGLDGEALDIGTNIVGLALYTRSEVGEPSATAPMTADPAHDSLTYSRHVAATQVAIGATETFEWPVSGQMVGEEYHLLLPAQASAIAPTAAVTIWPAEGHRVVSPTPDTDGAVRVVGTLDEHLAVRVVLEPAG